MPDVLHIDTAALIGLFDDRYIRVVYGLIDPRFPDMVAYIGKTEGHVLYRYFQHLQDGLETAPTGCRERWLAELRSRRKPPGLCIIEQVGLKPLDLGERECYWICDYQSRGESWINRVQRPPLQVVKHRLRHQLSAYVAKDEHA